MNVKMERGGRFRSSTIPVEREGAAPGRQARMEERLQKIISRAGVASRRKAEKLILEGKVSVNGRIVTELGSKADPEQDHVKVDDRLLQPERQVYFALHKPAGVISALSDPQGRPVVTDLIRTRYRIYPAGRLDFNSEGLLLLTNDGELVRRVTRSGKVPKTYRVKVRGVPTPSDLKRLGSGLRLADGVELAPCRVKTLKSGNNSWFEVVLRQGVNRQIRRMFEAVGHPVMRLKRVRIGPVVLGSLPRGKWRSLTEREVRLLKR